MQSLEVDKKNGLPNTDIAQQKNKHKYFTQNWNDFANNHCFDPECGYLRNPILQNKISPQFTKLIQILENLSLFNDSHSLEIKIKQLIPKNLLENQKQLDLIFLRDCLSYILGKYLYLLKSQGVQQKSIIIPYPLSKLLIQSSSILGIKIGPTAAFSFNWQWNDTNKRQPVVDSSRLSNPQILNSVQIQQSDIQQLSLDDIKMRYFYSQHQQHQKIFFGTSIYSSYFLAQMVKSIYEINQTIQNESIPKNQKQEFIKINFQRISNQWKIIHKLMFDLSQTLDPEIFYYQIRIYIMGFNDISFEGYPGRFSSGGGSTGEDPCYQMFEKGMGILVEGPFAKVQVRLRQGMYSKHLQLQKYLQTHSKIRQFCKDNPLLNEQYQKCVKSYLQMNMIHNVFIRQYILKFIPKQEWSHKEGAGGNKIITVMNRWQSLKESNNIPTNGD